MESIDLHESTNENAALKARVAELTDDILRMTGEYNALIQTRVGLQTTILELENEAKVQALDHLTTLGEIQTHIESLPNIKADAIRDMLKHLNNYSSGWAKDADGNVYFLEKVAESYAKEIERGES